jgi:Zn finger protein HypA/HybF involved in hydrogenase expression
MTQKALACNSCLTPVKTNKLGHYYCPTCEPESADLIPPNLTIPCPDCGINLTGHFQTLPELIFGNCPGCGLKLGKHFKKGVNDNNG